MRFLKILMFISFFTLFLSCSNNSFFEFDEIEHYKRNISEEELFTIYNLKDNSGGKIKILEIIEGDYPKSVTEDFGNLLEKNGYTKSVLKKNKHEEINEIFSEKNCFIKTANACMPVYRDVLLFLKNGKTVGIAKICFECQKFHIVGTEKDRNDFGQCGDYEKLENLLK